MREQKQLRQERQVPEQANQVGSNATDEGHKFKDGHMLYIVNTDSDRT